MTQTTKTINEFNGHELYALGNVRTKLIDHDGALGLELIASSDARDDAPEVWVSSDMAALIAAELAQVTR